MSFWKNFIYLIESISYFYIHLPLKNWIHKIVFMLNFHLNWKVQTFNILFGRADASNDAVYLFIARGSNGCERWFFKLLEPLTLMRKFYKKVNFNSWKRQIIYANPLQTFRAQAQKKGKPTQLVSPPLTVKCELLFSIDCVRFNDETTQRPHRVSFLPLHYSLLIWSMFVNSSWIGWLSKAQNEEQTVEAESRLWTVATKKPQNSFRAKKTWHSFTWLSWQTFSGHQKKRHNSVCDWTSWENLHDCCEKPSRLRLWGQKCFSAALMMQTLRLAVCKSLYSIRGRLVTCFGDLMERQSLPLSSLESLCWHKESIAMCLMRAQTYDVWFESELRK